MEIGGDIHSDLMPNGNVGMNHNYKTIVKKYTIYIVNYAQ